MLQQNVFFLNMNCCIVKCFFGWFCTLALYCREICTFSVYVYGSLSYLVSHCQICKIRKSILRTEEKSPWLFRDYENTFQLLLDCVEVFLIHRARSSLSSSDVW